MDLFFLSPFFVADVRSIMTRHNFRLCTFFEFKFPLAQQENVDQDEEEFDEYSSSGRGGIQQTPAASGVCKLATRYSSMKSLRGELLKIDPSLKSMVRR